MGKQLTWVTRGFEAFGRGTFGNAGQNLYISRKGVLQRIFLFDLNRDGFFDLVFCNAQEHWEQPPAYVYSEVMGARTRREVPSDGAVTGVLADLNGDGLDDLVLGMMNNGVDRELAAFVYYGGAEGLSEMRHARLPAPWCTSLAAGDFNGDGKVDLAFVSRGKLRLFYQSKLGFEPMRHAGLTPELACSHVDAADLDGDGFADLYVFAKGKPARVYWGGRDGISASRFTEVTGTTGGEGFAAQAAVSAEEGSGAIEAMARIVRWRGEPHVFVAEKERALLAPVRRDRAFGKPVVFDCPGAIAVAVTKGDDVVFAARDRSAGGECSWLFPGGDPGKRVALATVEACDVAVGDLDGDGRDEIVVCQFRDAESFSVESPVFSSGGKLLTTLTGAGARRVFIGRTAAEKHPQVIFVNQSGREATGRVAPVIYWGGKDGFAPERKSLLSGIGTVTAAGCDVNDDGVPDLLTVNCAENAMDLDPGSFVFYGTKEGFGREPDQKLPTKNAMALIVADVNRDGYLDVIISSFSSHEILIFFGSEHGFDAQNPQRIVVEEEGVQYIEGRRMCLADLNNDGYLDLVLTFNANDRTFVLWGGPDGFSFARRQTLSVTRSSTPMAADLTGNGYLDLIIGGHKRSDSGPHDSFVHIYWNGPEGLREDRKTLLPANAVLGMAVADLNNDGVKDLLVVNYSNGRERDIDSLIYWGQKPKPGEPMFSAARVTHFRTHSASGCVAVDFNEDGYIDLAIANHKTRGDHLGESWVVWNGPKGLDFANPTILPTSGPHGMFAAPPGNQADRGEEEFYVSEAYEVPTGAKVTAIEWEAELGPKTWIRGEVRAAASREGLERAEWTSVEKLGEGRWIQYRLALGAKNSGSTPRVREVRVVF